MTPLTCNREALRAVVFDLDGTLYQDERLGNEVNLSACRYLAFLKGVTLAKADAMLQESRGSCGGGGTLSRAVVALGGELKELHRRFSQEIHPQGILEPDPRVVELLGKLAGRFELHLYTNNNQALSQRIMAQIGVSGCFKKVFTIEDSWRPKPDREVLQGILEAIGCRPGETLFVGDRYEVDLELPATLGCQVYLAQTVEELLELEQLAAS